MNVVTQSVDDFGGQEKLNKLISKAEKERKHEAPFKEWQYKLDRRDKLPRGRWFRGKKAGKPALMLDEASFLLRKT